MNKQELIATVADSSGLVRGDAVKAVDAVFEAITAALKKGDEVRLVGFGTFSVSKRKASTGRNPRTGEPMTIKASSQPKFKPGKLLRASVNAFRWWGWTGGGSPANGPSPGYRARSSAVEHTLHTGGVTGSIPVAPTMQMAMAARSLSNGSGSGGHFAFWSGALR